MRKIRTELIPVIHVVDYDQLYVNLDICVRNGIGKVFLITHRSLPYYDMLTMAMAAKQRHPKLWVGLNMLDLSAREALSLDSLSIQSVDGIWCDGSISVEDISYFKTFEGMHFGGLAFKYQRQPTDLQQACADAKLTTDVATTSGPATGKPASVEKIKTIREYLGDHKLAIASGVSIDNVDSYLGMADYLLVASSITNNDEVIDEPRLVQLKNKIDEHYAN